MAVTPRDRGNRITAAPDRQFNASELSKKVLETITKTSENINVVNNDTVQKIADDYRGFANDLLKPLKNHSLKVDTKTFKVENEIISKLSSELSNVANDNFSGKTFDVLNNIYKEETRQAKLLKNIEKNTGINIVSKSGNMSESPSGYLEDIEDNTSFLGSLFNTMKYFTAQSLKIMGLQNSRISRLFKVNDEWYDMDRERYEWEVKNRVKEKLSFGQKAIRTVKNIVTPDEDNKGIIAKAMRGTAAVAGFYGAIGNMTGSLLKGTLSKFGFLGSAVGLKGVLIKVSTLLLGFGGLFAGIAALVTGAAFLSIMKNPEYLTKYAGAFMNIWQKNFVPVWEYLAGLGAKFMEWWKSGGESGIVGIGNFINEIMIYLIGNAIPNLLTIVGSSIKSVINMLYNIVMIPADLVANIFNGILEIGARIMGIFGLGKYGGDGFIRNIIGLLTAPGEMFEKIFSDMGQRIWNIFAQAWDTLLTTLGAIDEMLGITWMINKIDELIVNTGKYLKDTVSKMWDDLINWLGETITSFTDWLMSFPFFSSLVGKIKSMLDAVLDYIPKASSITKWIKSKIPNWASGFFGGDEEEDRGPTVDTTSPDYPVPGYGENFPLYEPPAEKTTFENAKEYANDVKDAMIDGIVGAFSSTKNFLVGTSNEIVDKATERLSQIDTEETYRKAGEYIDIAKTNVGRATQVIIDNSNHAKNNVSQVAANVQHVSKGAINSGLEHISGFSQRFNSPGGY